MTFEVGKRYKTRDGQETSPLRPYDGRMNHKYAFAAEVGNALLSWSQRGVWDPDSPLLDRLDLMPGALDDEPAKPVFEIGKRYRMRSGEIAGPLEAYRGNINNKYAFQSGLVDRDGYTTETWDKNGRYQPNETSDFDLLLGAIEDDPKPELTAAVDRLVALGERQDADTSVRRAQGGDVYVDPHGKLWRVRWTFQEPTVDMIEVEPSNSGDPLHRVPQKMFGGITGAMWDGFKRIYRPEGK